MGRGRANFLFAGTTASSNLDRTISTASRERAEGGRSKGKDQEGGGGGVGGKKF